MVETSPSDQEAARIGRDSRHVCVGHFGRAPDTIGPRSDTLSNTGSRPHSRPAAAGNDSPEPSKSPATIDGTDVTG